MRSPVLPLLAAALLVASSSAQAAWVPVLDVNELVIKQVAQFAVLVYGLAHHKDLGRTWAWCVGRRSRPWAAAPTSASWWSPRGPTTAGAPRSTTAWCGGVPGSRSDTWKLRRFRKIVQG